MEILFYHTKPYLLMIGGSIVVFSTSNIAAIGFGVILVLVGGLIYKMRKNNRGI